MMRKNRKRGIEGAAAQTAIYIVMAIVVLLVMLPVILTFFMSFKSNFELAGSIWALPKEWLFSALRKCSPICSTA